MKKKNIQSKNIKFDRHGTSIKVANMIITDGYEKYYDEGTRLGFFDDSQEPKIILNRLLKLLEKFEEYELAGQIHKIIQNM